MARKGQINAWDNPDFVDAVKATGNRCNWRCVRRQDQVKLYRVRDLSLVQLFYLRVMGLGNVLVLSSGISTPNDHLLAVRQPLVQELRCVVAG